MPEVIISDYFYGAESEEFIYFKIPRLLITDPKFKHVSTDAKLLYGMLLDRMGLSAKNDWYDDHGRVYIYYTVDEICPGLRGRPGQGPARHGDQLRPGLCLPGYAGHQTPLGQEGRHIRLPHHPLLRSRRGHPGTGPRRRGGIRPPPAGGPLRGAGVYPHRPGAPALPYRF